MDASLFRRFQELVARQAGIALKEGKEDLLIARIAKRQRALGLGSPRAYLRHLEADRSGEELVCFLDAITTHFTCFLRESDHFDFLADAVKRWRRQGRQRMRLWSAASSTGEEPYTMAMTVLEALEGEPGDVRILATDLSTAVLHRARAGVYDDAALAPLPAALRLRYFTRVSEGAWRAGESLRRMVVFKRLNLSAPPFPMRGPLDVVFCRNVMIYFDQGVRQRLVAAVESLLKPGGFLAVGHAETLAGLRSGLHALCPSLYARPGPS